MTYTKTIVCLANSRKPPSGRCVAGRESTGSGFGSWVRPVSARSTQEISEEERNYRDGRDPAVLDVIDVPLAAPQPQHHQTENHVIDPGYYWTKRGTVSWRRLQGAVEDSGQALWTNGSSSSNGENDRVAEAEANSLARSLYLVRPEDLVLSVSAEGGDFGTPRRRVRARFVLGASSYRLSVTDPVIERNYLREPDGEYEIEDALLCVSLAEAFHGYAYKLVAALITKQRAGG
jgi:hypothetical protein